MYKDELIELEQATLKKGGKPHLFSPVSIFFRVILSGLLAFLMFFCIYGSIDSIYRKIWPIPAGPIDSSGWLICLVLVILASSYQLAWALTLHKMKTFRPFQLIINSTVAGYIGSMVGIILYAWFLGVVNRYSGFGGWVYAYADILDAEMVRTYFLPIFPSVLLALMSGIVYTIMGAPSPMQKWSVSKFGALMGVCVALIFCLLTIPAIVRQGSADYIPHRPDNMFIAIQVMSLSTIPLWLSTGWVTGHIFQFINGEPLQKLPRFLAKSGIAIFSLYVFLYIFVFLSGNFNLGGKLTDLMYRIYPP